MDEHGNYYRTGEFARLAAVTPRTLRFYDRSGLLSPSHYSESGYRLYSDDDLVDLQQILALKFLGFTLEEIREVKQNGAGEFARALAQQKQMLRDRQRQLEQAIAAVERVQRLLARGETDWQAIAEILQVIQMEPKKEWVDKYFTPEQRRKLEELRKDAYSDEAKRKLAERPRWTEEDQKRVDDQYRHIAAELRRLVSEGADPGGEEAQSLAALQIDLVNQFTRNDPDIEAGLGNFWRNFNELPAAERPPALPWGEDEGELLSEAVEIYRQRQGDS